MQLHPRCSQSIILCSVSSIQCYRKYSTVLPNQFERHSVKLTSARLPKSPVTAHFVVAQVACRVESFHASSPLSPPELESHYTAHFKIHYLQSSDRGPSCYRSLFAASTACRFYLLKYTEATSPSVSSRVSSIAPTCSGTSSMQGCHCENLVQATKIKEDHADASLW